MSDTYHIVGRRMVEAIREGKSVNVGNTSVTCNDGGVWTVALFGNVIAERKANQDGFSFTLAGSPTVATRNRVNTLLHAFAPAHARVHQMDHEQFFGDYQIGSDQWIRVESDRFATYPNVRPRNNKMSTEKRAKRAEQAQMPKFKWE
jgi:hypothetical protein